MPNISHRGEQAPESPIRRLVPFAEAAQKKGTKVYFLNIGQPDLEPPTQFWDGIHQVSSKMVAYTHSLGNATLREGMRMHLAARGVDLKENELIVTTAGSEALLFAMFACLEPGDEVIVPEPLYANYIGFAAIAGVVVRPIPTHIENNFALPDASAFEERINERTKAILICNPNNPTGTVYAKEHLLALARIAKENDLFLISDEVYREFNYTGHPITSVLELQGMDDHVICVDSVSKRFSLCGARIGFFMSRNAKVMQAAIRFAQARLSPPAIEQIGVEAALATPQSYFDGVREEYIQRRDVLVAGLQKMNGVVCPQIDGAFYAMVRLPIDDSDRFCQWMLEEFSHEGQTVMMAPGTGFYATRELGLDQVRIAYVLKSEDLEKALDVLRAGLAVYPGRTADQSAVLA